MKKTHVVTLLVCLLAFSCEKVELESTPEVSADTTIPNENIVSQYRPYIAGSDKAPDLSQWVYVWGDEFDGTRLNESKWNITVSNRSRNPRRDKGINDWRWQRDHVSLNGNGQLLLKSSKVGRNAMRCGSIDSQNKFEPLYGYMEARIQVAETRKANHTAFWITGNGQGNIDGTGNDGAEVDIFESAWTGQFTKAVVHIDGYGSAHRANTKRFETPGIHNGYHIYGLEWGPDQMTVYYDGVPKVTYRGIWVPKVKEWLWLSVGASFGDGDFLSQPLGTLSHARVDYVRVYKKRNNAFRLVNKQSKKWFRTVGTDDDSQIRQASYRNTGGWTTWNTKVSENQYFYLVNTESNKYIRPTARTDRSGLVLKNNDFSGAWTQWYTVDAGDGYFYIVNRETNMILTTDSNSDNAAIVIRPWQSRNDASKWKFEHLKE